METVGFLSGMFFFFLAVVREANFGNRVVGIL